MQIFNVISYQDNRWLFCISDAVTIHDWLVQLESHSQQQHSYTDQTVYMNQIYMLDWQQLFIWLWWWLLLRLLKCQSLLPTTVLLKTTLTQTITPHDQILFSCYVQGIIVTELSVIIFIKFCNMFVLRSFICLERSSNNYWKSK